MGGGCSPPPPNGPIVTILYLKNKVVLVPVLDTRGQALSASREPDPSVFVIARN